MPGYNEKCINRANNPSQIPACETNTESWGLQKYRYPVHFNSKYFLDSSFDIIPGKPFDITIWFSATQARYIKERCWSRTQQIQDNKDGSIIFSMTTSGWDDVKRWILSQGPHARVMAPKSMKKQIFSDIRDMAAYYES